MPPRNTKLLNINVCHSKLNLQLIVFILLMAILNLTVHAAEKTKELVILNWSEYMNINMIQAFEKEYNVKIKEVYYESDDARDEIMLQTEGKGFDIIIANGAIVKSYIKRHWLKPLQKDKIPNLKHIDNIWKSAFESIDDYDVPYFWGTLGIAYRKDLVSEPITSWMQLYRPSKELRQNTDG